MSDQENVADVRTNSPIIKCLEVWQTCGTCLGAPPKIKKIVTDGLNQRVKDREDRLGGGGSDTAKSDLDKRVGESEGVTRWSRRRRIIVAVRFVGGTQKSTYDCLRIE